MIQMCKIKYFICDPVLVTKSTSIYKETVFKLFNFMFWCTKRLFSYQDKQLWIQFKVLSRTDIKFRIILKILDLIENSSESFLIPSENVYVVGGRVSYL